MAKIDVLFKAMLDLDGSDLHLEQGQVPKIRAQGEIREIPGYPVLTQEVIHDYLEEITPSYQWEQFEKTGDMDFAYDMGESARFRANLFRHFDGYGGIFRIIPTKILTLEQLGAPEVFKSFADLRSGLVLVTGPTGSGKSTTLAAIIDFINTNYRKKIITIEDPVEFVHPPKTSLITHREVHAHTNSFTTGLQGAIKSDVDVILVGEMRDEETIELALTAVEMGILVFGTLHTNSAAKTIDRIIDVFPAKKKPQIRNILANSLQAVVSQQLLKSADRKRRWAAHEILLSTSALPGIIRSGETTKLVTLIQMSRGIGMISMDDCLAEMLKDEKIDQGEAFLKAIDKERFKK